MPGGRKPVPAFWVDRVKVIAVNEPDLSGKDIEDRLRQEANGRNDYPGERKIRQIKASITEEDRIEHRLFRWPQSFESGALPWEASKTALELLRTYPNGKRPTNRLVRWFWRVTQAAPEYTFDLRAYIAYTMVACEITGVEKLKEFAELQLRTQPVGSLPTLHLMVAGMGNPDLLEETFPPQVVKTVRELICVLRVDGVEGLVHGAGMSNEEALEEGGDNGG